MIFFWFWYSAVDLTDLHLPHLNRLLGGTLNRLCLSNCKENHFHDLSGSKSYEYNDFRVFVDSIETWTGEDG